MDKRGPIRGVKQPGIHCILSPEPRPGQMPGVMYNACQNSPLLSFILFVHAKFSKLLEYKANVSWFDVMYDIK